MSNCLRMYYQGRQRLRSAARGYREWRRLWTTSEGSAGRARRHSTSASTQSSSRGITCDTQWRPMVRGVRTGCGFRFLRVCTFWRELSRVARQLSQSVCRACRAITAFAARLPHWPHGASMDQKGPSTRERPSLQRPRECGRCTPFVDVKGVRASLLRSLAARLCRAVARGPRSHCDAPSPARSRRTGGRSHVARFARRGRLSRLPQARALLRVRVP